MKYDPNERPAPITRRKEPEPVRELSDLTKARLIFLHSLEAWEKISPLRSN